MWGFLNIDVGFFLISLWDFLDMDVDFFWGLSCETVWILLWDFWISMGAFWIWMCVFLDFVVGFFGI